MTLTRRTVQTGAARNGPVMSRVSSSVWLSEPDMAVVGADRTVGVIRNEPCASGRELKIAHDTLREVIAAGKGAGPEDKVGTRCCNDGVMLAALMVEGVRRASRIAPDGPVTGPWPNAGPTSIANFDAEGMIPPATGTPEETLVAATTLQAHRAMLADMVARMSGLFPRLKDRAGAKAGYLSGGARHADRSTGFRPNSASGTSWPPHAPCSPRRDSRTR